MITSSISAMSRVLWHSHTRHFSQETAAMPVFYDRMVWLKPFDVIPSCNDNQWPNQNNDYSYS